jgi:putative transposase
LRRFVGLSRSTARYQKRPRADEAEPVERLKQFARKRHRQRRGYRLAHQELRRAGLYVNHKRVFRLWRREGLCVPARRRPRKRVRNAAPPREVVADRPNAVWCLDFVEDGVLGGSKLRILSVTDEFTRESLALEVGRSFKSERVCEVLEGLIAARGAPGALRMDNGPEFVAFAVRGLCQRRGISAAYIAPGSPWQNGIAESFHARLRDEFLDAEAFLSVIDARVRLGGWRRCGAAAGRLAALRLGGWRRCGWAAGGAAGTGSGWAAGGATGTGSGCTAAWATKRPRSSRQGGPQKRANRRRPRRLLEHRKGADHGGWRRRSGPWSNRTRRNARPTRPAPG